MWIAQGFFDQDPAHATEISELSRLASFSDLTRTSTESRVLKPGCSVAIGRKNQPIIINSKKISSEHCVLNVSNFSLEDVSNPEERPSLQVFNPRDKSMSIRRNGVLIPLNGNGTMDLQDGDEIGLANGIMVLVTWQLKCYVPHPTPSIISACVALGINVVQSPHPSVDYHITALYIPTPEIGISLLSRCQFVKLDWLEEVIELCNDPEIRDYVPPPLSKYRPAFSPSLDPKHKKFNVWEPNPMRSDLFHQCRFLCVAEKDRDIDSAFREFIARGAGAIETFCASDGIFKWREALKRGAAKDATLVLVADQKAVIAAAGESCWQDLCEEASRYHKRFFSTVDLIQTVLSVDTTIFKTPSDDYSQNRDEGRRYSSPLPDCVPNSFTEEMTVPPEEARPASRRRGPSRQPSEEPTSQPSKPLTRRRAPSREPSSQQTQTQEDPPPRPRQPLTRRGPTSEVSSSESANPQIEVDIPPPARKPLTRRVKAGVPVLSGLGDSSVIINAAVAASDPPKPSSSAPSEPMILDLTAPVPPRSTKLKRRFGADSAQFSSMATSEPPEEPVLKKFKALFEATNDPDQADVLMSQLLVDDTSTESQSRPSTAVDAHNTGTTFRQTLDTISEDTQTPSSSSSNPKGRKRKAALDGEDMIDVENEATSQSRAGSIAPASKKQAIEQVNAVVPSSQKPPSTAKAGKVQQGAPPGKPDTDPVFLKAVASTKRGKKTEDDFDREFNKLKLSKPELGRDKESPEDEWAILDDFQNDQNIRGNFMVIVEMDAYKDRFPDKRPAAINPEWDGQPNFKKFKRKRILPQAKRIELVVSENSDHVEGSWKEDLSVRAPNSPADDLSDGFTYGGRALRSQPLPADDSDEEFPVKSRKHNSRAGSRKAGTGRATRLSAKSQPLFLDNDEDDEVASEINQPEFSDIDEEDLDQTLASTTSTTRSARRTVAVKPKKPVIIDDDSDEDAFKGFKGRRRK
ncbi:proline-rich protein [Lentinula detonsa]|uniref:Proline-rich protein n=1 Tax=Lentinula detonsa TaxID=2804962 RepID=A0A9W8P3Y7_9AGAR|nr:proline-rich protein [Lentinula detonsa]